MSNGLTEEQLAHSYSQYRQYVSARKQYKEALTLWTENKITLKLLCLKRMAYDRATRSLKKCTK